jgi:hypothetical protein
MPLNKLGVRTEVIDIVAQLAKLHEQREGLLGVNSIRALYSVLEDIERSVDVLHGCVAAVKYRIGLKVSEWEQWGT